MTRNGIFGSSRRHPRVIPSANNTQSAETNLLFAYGTLRRGFERHRHLERLGAQYNGEGSIAGELFDLGQFPGARKSGSDARRVQGEVYCLPAPSRVLAVLDAIEWVRKESPKSSLFAREITEASLLSGERVRAWVYWLNHWHGPMRRIASGDYRRG